MDSKISNLNKYIETSEDAARNISNHWASEELETKRRIQELIFPDGIVIDVKNRVYLTKTVNTIFELSADIARVTEEAKEKRQLNNQLPFPLVVLTDQISNQEIDELKILSTLSNK